MIRIAVMYPRQGAGASAEEPRFDLDYYRDRHLPLVKEKLSPLSIEIDVGVTDIAGAPPPFIAIGYLTFDSMEELRQRYGDIGTELQADIPNFTDITPVMQASIVVENDLS